MKSENEILEESKKEVGDSGNQSWHSISLVCIERSRKDLFDWLQEQASLEENKNLSAEEFFDKMEYKIIW